MYRLEKLPFVKDLKTSFQPTTNQQLAQTITWNKLNYPKVSTNSMCGICRGDQIILKYVMNSTKKAKCWWLCSTSHVSSLSTPLTCGCARQVKMKETNYQFSWLETNLTWVQIEKWLGLTLKSGSRLGTSQVTTNLARRRGTATVRFSALFLKQFELIT